MVHLSGRCLRHDLFHQWTPWWHPAIVDGSRAGSRTILGSLSTTFAWPRDAMDGGKQMDCKVLLVSFVTFHSYGPFRSPTLSQKYRIGNLSPEDAKKAADFQFGDMYETDPIRDPNNLGCTVKPWCGEPRIDLLTRDYITPNELFYVRNHLAVPDIEPEDYELVIKGKGIKKHKFTLEDLKTKFPKHEVVTTLQCAGNRREDMHDDVHKIFIAPHWVVGAMSTAKWGGVKIRDVLKYCGLDVDGMALGTNNPSDIKHVQFEGYDTDETGLCYGGSIPIDKAVDGLGDAIFAFEMNGEPLPRDHGYPVRAIAPGHAGARQVRLGYIHLILDL